MGGDIKRKVWIWKFYIQKVCVVALSESGTDHGREGNGVDIKVGRQRVIQ